MKINKIKVNSYGKLKDKEINLQDGINIIYGENESGKSTLLKFIINSFYGISKNKKGKKYSDYEKYMPWVGEEFSGKIEYELNNNQKYEVYRDFKKKNPKIFNERKEEISKQFNIDKNRENEFFYEQTKVDEELFLSTILVQQQEVKLGKQERNILVQKIANLVGTGEDNVSYKKAMDRINRRQLEEVGTQRSREKPINILSKQIQDLEKEKEELEKYEDLKYEIEERKNTLKQETLNLEDKIKLLKEQKWKEENRQLEEEKVRRKESNEKETKSTRRNERQKKKLNTKIIIGFLLLILLNSLLYIFIKNIVFSSIFLVTIPCFLLIALKIKHDFNKKIETNKKDSFDETNLQKYSKNNLKVNLEIDNLQEKINDKKIELNKLELEQKNIKPKLENLVKIEEELVNHKNRMLTLNNLNTSFDIVKNKLTQVYENMKNTITPKFTKELSNNILEITNGKYKNITFNDEEGLMVELENGNYVPASKLSIGTIDQLYLSLRLSMVEDLSTEAMPIILDEAFAYYDTNRLKNILKYMSEKYKNHQIIIFTCTNREKEILDELGIPFYIYKLV